MRAYDPIDDDDFLNKVEYYAKVRDERRKDLLFDESFNDSNYEDFINEAKKVGFINKGKGRGVIIGGKQIYDYNKAANIFESAAEKLSSDPKVREAADELGKSLGNSKEAKMLKEELLHNSSLVDVLAKGRKGIILAALKSKWGAEADNLAAESDTIIAAIRETLDGAKESETEFTKALKIYKTRFNTPFEITIANKRRAIIGREMPVLEFVHKSHEEKTMDEGNPRKILSSGETTALDIISFIVKYEEAKKDGKNPVVVLDDIVETFDYANRYGFIMYIKEIVDSGGRIIVMTHNYEFYRTLHSRAPSLGAFMASGNNNGVVTISKNSKANFDAEKIFSVNKVEDLIFCIPYMREIQMMRGATDDVEELNSYLHYTCDTSEKSICELVDIFGSVVSDKSLIHKVEGIAGKYKDKTYLAVLAKCADSVRSGNQYDLKEKTIHAIACRVLLEEKLLTNGEGRFKCDVKHLLAYALKNCQDVLGKKAISVINKVQVSTPEFIHANASMYEPLIDIDGSYLKEIYEEVKRLEPKNIVKESN